jgi:hypothetical protein
LYTAPAATAVEGQLAGCQQQAEVNQLLLMQPILMVRLQLSVYVQPTPKHVSLMRRVSVCCAVCACSGRHNPEIAAELFPEWPEDKRTAFYEEKEQRFRDMAGERDAQ